MGSVFIDRKRAGASIALAAAAVLAGMCTVGVGLEHAEYISSAAVASATPPRQLAISANASGETAAQPSPEPIEVVAQSVSPVTAQAAFSPVPTANVAALNINVSNSRIDKWVQRLATSAKGDFEKSLARMGRYASMITTKLDQRGMPHDLTYLAMIESEFNPTARSHVGAVGLWQFMGSTARRFGLKVGHGVDERTDPAAETDAALTYLSDLYHRFGSWYLAAAAYNSGEGTVARALKRVTGRTTGTDADFFKILPNLPRETQDYVPKLIASARIGNDPEAYGVAPGSTQVASASVATTQAPATVTAPGPRLTPAVDAGTSAKHVSKARHTSRRIVRHHATTAHRRRRRHGR